MKLQEKTLKWIRLANEVIDEDAVEAARIANEHGINLPIGKLDGRSIYYALEAKQLILPKEYEKLEYALRIGRKTKDVNGNLLIDPSKIIDLTRDPEAVVDRGDESPSKFLTLVKERWKYYDRNFWDEQSDYVEVWLEKLGLAPLFAPICQKYNVRLEITKGDDSISKEWEAARRFESQREKGKRCVMLWLGDFNPQGVMITPQAILRNMALYGFKFDKGQPERVMLNFNHIKKYNLPENPTKKTTKKDITIANRFIKHYGDVNVELNSLRIHGMGDMIRLLEIAIASHVDRKALQHHQKVVEKEREEIRPRIRISLKGLI